jgi:UDP-glucose:(heptosyl)LPS alpha-1,3-glucosyltransferase
LRLALVLRRFGGAGGTEKYASDLAGWLASRGHAVDVWAVDAVAIPGVRVRPLAPALRKGALGDLALGAAARAVPTADYDVVMGFGRTWTHNVWRAGGGCHASWLAARGGLAAWSPGERLAVAIERASVRAARVVVANSEMAARELRVFHGLPEERVRVVRNGVDAERFRPDAGRRAAARLAWRVPETGKVALFLGNGFRRKNLPVAAAAFAKVAGPDDRLVIAGRDAHAERWIAPIRASLGDRLVVAGPTDAPEIALAGADATLLPTLYDAAANTTIEALACGVPAVTSGRDGNAEIAPDERLVVPDPSDVEGFARALAWAWSAGSSLSATCRKAALAWPVSRNGESLERLYRELVDG